MKLPRWSDAADAWESFSYATLWENRRYHQSGTTYEQDYDKLCADCAAGDKEALDIADQFVIYAVTQKLIE